MPDVNSLVLRGCGHKLVVRGDSNSINVLLMRHDSHLCGVDNSRAFFTISSCGVPDLKRVVLADRGKELVLFRCKAYARDILIVTIERCLALDALLERFRRVKTPQFDSVIFCTTEEEGMICIGCNYVQG